MVAIPAAGNDPFFDGALFEAEPGDSYARCALGQTLHLKGDLRGAMREYTEALRRDPACAIAHVGMGSVEEDGGIAAGKEEEDCGAMDTMTCEQRAEGHYRRALELDAANAQARCRLGGLLFASEQCYDLDGAAEQCAAARR
jgi:tetratricopeptide (TPR) repeat protein